MLDKIKNAINSLLRIQRGTGNQFATHDARGTLIETKTFLRKYVRLIVGLFIAVVCVSYAFVRLVETLMVEIVLPLINNLTKKGGALEIKYENLIAYVMMFVVVIFIAWVLIRKLSGSIEVPQEERARRCPMCGEQILEMAIRCKHCGSTVGRERTQTYHSSSRDSSFSSRDNSHPRHDRYPGSRGNRPSSPSGDRDDSSRSSVQGSSQRSSSDSIHRRRSSSYHARRKDGRYHSRYDQQRSYQPRNDQPREETKNDQQASTSAQ
jgi:large-conductance mechanosensitive channel